MKKNQNNKFIPLPDLSSFLLIPAVSNGFWHKRSYDLCFSSVGVDQRV
jgi:hypothetical protein